MGEGKILVIKQTENEGPGKIEPFFTERGWDLQILDMSAGESLPERLDAVAALVILGGHMNVYEEKRYPFLKAEELLIRKAFVEEVPILGICLGAQMLAKTCGARVRKAPEKELGWYRVKRTAEAKSDPLFQGSPEHMQVFQWHGDTFDLPAGAVLLMEGKACRNQAFRAGQNAYGLQFHVEITEPMIRNWIETGGEDVSVEKVLKETERIKESYDEQANRIFTSFMHIIESSQRLRKVIKVFVEDGKEARKKRHLLWWDMKERTLLPREESDKQE